MKKHDWRLDFIKIVAIIFVLYNHLYCYSFIFSYDLSELNILHYVLLIPSLLCKCGSALFFMVSGVVLLGKNETYTKIISHRVSRILIVMAAISIISGICNRSISSLISTFLGGLNWYLYAYLAFLLMLPIFRRIVQNFSDDNDVITNLGIDNVEQIRKDAMIAKSNAQREIAIAEASNAKEANDAKVKAAEDMAVRNNDLAIKQAQLKQEADTRQAQANAAAGIEEENQRKLRDVAATDANIAKAEREAELKQKEIQLKEYELDALVRKQADADKYAAEKKAEADLIRRQKDAEAKAYEMEQEARAMKAKADADKYAAEQKAAGIAAVGEAEASAIEKKAEAQKKFGEASVIEMYLKALPEAVKAAAEPLHNVDGITIYGEGGNTKIVSDVMQSVDKVLNGLGDATGIDLKKTIAQYLNK